MKCIGFGDLTGLCTAEMSQVSTLWCTACDAARKLSITNQFESILDDWPKE